MLSKIMAKLKERKFKMAKTINTPIPDYWNKYFVNVKVHLIKENNLEIYEGYIWPSNNWVELHCFKNAIKKQEFTFVEHTQMNVMSEISAHIVPIPRPVKKYFRSTNIHYSEHVVSLIAPRHKVYFSKKNNIYYKPNQEDVDRWFKWHPENDFFEIIDGDIEGWYLAESHGGLYTFYKITENEKLVLDTRAYDYDLNIKLPQTKIMHENNKKNK